MKKRQTNKSKYNTKLNMINTRTARTDDEAWILGKLSQENINPDSFRPEDFIVAVNENTEERIGFGCIQYHRNIVDDTEYVEMNHIIVLDRATNDQGRLLLVELARQAKKSGNQQVFTFPHSNHDLFEDVGFEKRSPSDMPEVMQERIKSKEEKHSSINSYSAQPKNINYQIESDDEFTKPEGTTQEEVDSIKEELGLNDNTNTKYSI